MIYRSKKDGWLVALVGAAALLPFAGTIYSFAVGNVQEAWISFLVGAGVGTLILLTYPTRYELMPSALKVRSGVVFRRQIPLSAIQEVYPTRNPLSAPAWSLDRLHVSYGEHGEGFLLISPENKAGFVLELTRRDAELVMRGERVVRAE